MGTSVSHVEDSGPRRARLTGHAGEWPPRYGKVQRPRPTVGPSRRASHSRETGARDWGRRPLRGSHDVSGWVLGCCVMGVVVLLPLDGREPA
jgi:hypothetical protein